MATTNERQRAAARARLEREMAERAAAAHKRRRRTAIACAGLALVVVVAGMAWLVGSLRDDDGDQTAAPDASSSAAGATCTWNEVPKDQRTPTVKDVGVPPSTTPPNTGNSVMTIDTSFGVVNVTMDLSKVPCTAASFAHLASKNFFDGSKCHRILPGLLQCGDPSARGKGYRETDGTGGPAYRFANENLPVDQRPAYPAGVVAMANSGPDTNGSQFFIVYKDTELPPNYTVLGRVTAGLDVVEKATAAGHDGAFDPQPGGGHPKSEIVIKDVTVGAS